MPSRTARPKSRHAVRPADMEDLDALVALEDAVFDNDRLSRRSFRRLLASPTAQVLVAKDGAALTGYALLLFRNGTAVARLYSIAISPEARGRGVGGGLMAAAEAAAFDHDCLFLRLEVRPDNAAAIKLYEEQGFRRFGRHLDYYVDHADALRYEKRLSGPIPAHVQSPPYYPQTTDFTCGPAAMIMALSGLKPGLSGSRRLELRLWREATTIFMAGGLGGCEPYGMAVALAQHGLRPSIWLKTEEYFFVANVRGEAKRDVMRIAQQDFRDAARKLDIAVRHRMVSKRFLLPVLLDGAMAIVLISGYRMLRERTPHWILAYGGDDTHVYVHDPWVGEEHMETTLSAAKLPIPWAEFERMARFGRGRRGAAIIVRKDNET